jgi:hypothetical protein
MLVLLAVTPVMAPAARAGQHLACDTTVFRVSAGILHGEPIRTVTIRTLGPDALPGPTALLNALHVRTREGTVRRQLLFAPGDTVDSLRFAESLRRLRNLRYLGDASLTGQHCPGQVGVDLTVTTVDRWTTNATVQAGKGNNTLVGITERNLLGTGREASLNVRSDRSRVGVGVTWADPWFLDERLSLKLGSVTFRRGDERYAVLETRERSVLDRTRAELGVFETRQRAGGITDEVVDRLGAAATITRRVRVDPEAATFIPVGIEVERTALAARLGSFLVGPANVRRSFAGVTSGVIRRSLAHDTVTWVLPARGILDVPLALEADFLVGVGGDAVTRAPAAHFDGWIGKTWLSRPAGLASAGAWLSGYLIDGALAATSLRASLLATRPAQNGLWTARLGAERVLNADPDVRQLSLFDPTAAALPDSLRLAETAVSAAVERTVRLGFRSRSWGVGLGTFAAASARWDAAREVREMEGVAVIGVGLRLDPSRGSRSLARLDVGFPVSRLHGRPQRVFIAASIDPSLGGDRQRPGRRMF